MEDLLATWFNLSENWGAILLIDEADVYFERRAIGQLQRNSLVSAFLRSMEYYRGILFLTVCPFMPRNLMLVMLIQPHEPD
jgi:hypothetical protein